MLLFYWLSFLPIAKPDPVPLEPVSRLHTLYPVALIALYMAFYIILKFGVYASIGKGSLSRVVVYLPQCQTSHKSSYFSYLIMPVAIPRHILQPNRYSHYKMPAFCLLHDFKSFPSHFLLYTFRYPAVSKYTRINLFDA